MQSNSLTAFYVIFVVGVLVVVGLGALIYVTTPTKAPWFQNTLQRFLTIRDVCVDQLGRYFAAVFILLAGAAAATIISWPIGRLARRYKPNIDAPFLRWTKSHVRDTGSWHHVLAVVTRVGNIYDTKIAVVIGAVCLAIIWGLTRRGFWIPLIAVPVAYGFEKFGQMALAKVVARQPTPLLSPDFGTFPSGGCGRVIIVYGTIWYLLTLAVPKLGRRGRVFGFTFLALMAFIEGYTRIFLIKHWLLDMLGGLLWGSMMLLAVIGALSCFRPKPTEAAAAA